MSKKQNECGVHPLLVFLENNAIVEIVEWEVSRTKID